MSEEKEHPEYPQDYEKIPSLRFIVEQVSKIEDAQACGTGYYKTLKDVLNRIGKLDVSLNQLTQTNADLKKVVAAEGLSNTLKERLDSIDRRCGQDLLTICDTVTRKVGSDLADIKHNQIEFSGRLTSEQFKLIGEIRQTNCAVANYQERFKALVNQTSNYLFPPWYHVWGLRLLILVAGIVIGKKVI